MLGLFFDASATMLAKNHLPIAKSISKMDASFEAVFLSVEISSNLNMIVENESEEALASLHASQFLKCSNFGSSNLSDILNEFKPDFVLIGAYRIYDQLLCAICKKLNIKVYNFQHGFEVNSVNYTIGGVLGKFRKSLKLLKTSFDLARFSNLNQIVFLKDYISYILGGESKENSLLRNEHFHPFHSFVYSEWYKSFWKTKFGFNMVQMTIITPPDFLLVDEVKDKEQIDGLCYITQTLVEDGRMTEKAFVNMLKEYRNIAATVKCFIIKLHPRARVEYYDVFKNMENVVIQREFPNASIYLTHYSSMIFAAARLSDRLILHELPGHATPEVFQQVNPHVVQDTEEIKDLIDDFDTSKFKRKGDNYSTELKNPYDEVAEKILTDYDIKADSI